MSRKKILKLLIWRLKNENLRRVKKAGIVFFIFKAREEKRKEMETVISS
jgi:hypothetical protein